MSNPNKESPIGYAFESMCDRINRMVAVLNDPYRRISETQRLAIRQACEAIEEEWILEPSKRAPRNKG